MTTKKQQLEQEFNQLRQAAVDSNEPTAFVLVEHNDSNPLPQFVIESFSMRTFIEQSGDEAVVRAHEEVRMYGRWAWLIDIVGDQFISEADAFQMAWDRRAHYHDQRTATATAVN
jgi:hypothetical protein